MPHLTGLCCTVAFLAAACARENVEKNVDDGASAIVTLSFGDVCGNLLQTSREFLGVPYASAQKRFMAATPWHNRYPSGKLDARSYSVQCTQAVASSLGPEPAVPMSEDCLHLNIYTPLPAKNTPKWPVMLWIHGGGLTSGSAMTPQFNGSQLATRENIVLVAINYRLGPLGFAPVRLPDGSVAANTGFLDQREAMRWVRAHISAFGGDGSLVTIFGESAGAKSTHTHVVMPGSVGLFDRAIAESSGIQGYVTLEQGLASSDLLAKSVSCTNAGDLECLRKADAAVLIANFPTFQLDPTVVGDETMPLPPIDLVQSGRFNKVPVLTSTNFNEGNLFVLSPLMPSLSYDSTRCVFEKHFPEKMTREALMEVYPPTNLSWVDNRDVISDLFSDIRFRCGDRSLSLAMASAGADVWMANFRRHASCLVGADNLPGVPHGADIPYVFGNIANDVFKQYNVSCTASAQDRALSEMVGSIWAGFARSGSASWPKFTAQTEEVLKIDLGLLTRIETDAGYRRVQCQALSAAGYAASANLSGNILSEMSACQHERSSFIIV